MPDSATIKDRLTRGATLLVERGMYEQDHAMQVLGGAMMLLAATEGNDNTDRPSSVTLHLSVEQEAKLRRVAESRNMTIEALAIQMLIGELPGIKHWW